MVADGLTRRGKFERPAMPSSDPVVHVDHPQVRISRVWARPGDTLTVAAASEPALLIALGAGAGLNPGEVRCVPAASDATLRNATATALDFLRFDFRTKPVETDR